MDPTILGFAVFLFVGFVLVTYMSINMYVKCPPNQALIISGFGAATGYSGCKVVVGGGAVVLPMIQQVNRLSLEVMKIAIKHPTPFISKDGIPLFVEATAQVKIKGDDVSILTAAEQLLGKSDEEISQLVYDSLVGFLRVAIGRLTVAELLTDFDKFAQMVQELAMSDLAKIGMTVVSISLSEIKDNVGYLESLAREHVAERKSASDMLEAMQNKEATLSTFKTEIELKLLRSLDVDYPIGIAQLAQYEQALPVLERALGEQSLVFKDFLMRYALILAARKDMLSSGKAEELLKRAEAIGVAANPVTHS